MRLLKFYSDTCVPCKTVGQMLDSIVLSVNVDGINIHTNTNPVREFRVRSIPTLILVDDQFKEVDRLVGQPSYEDLHLFLDNNNLL